MKKISFLIGTFLLSLSALAINDRARQFVAPSAGAIRPCTFSSEVYYPPTPMPRNQPNLCPRSIRVVSACCERRTDTSFRARDVLVGSPRCTDRAKPLLATWRCISQPDAGYGMSSEGEAHCYINAFSVSQYNGSNRVYLGDNSDIWHRTQDPALRPNDNLNEHQIASCRTVTRANGAARPGQPAIQGGATTP